MKIPNKHRCISVALAVALVAAGGIKLSLKSSHAMGASPASGPGSQKSEAVVLSPNSGPLTEFVKVEQPIRVSFATAMVPLEKVRRGGQPSPITFEPLVETRWIWVSQTEGKLTFPQQFVVDNIPWTLSQSARLGSILHRARLRPGLHDLAGKPIDPGTWGVEFSDNKFALKTWEFLNDGSVGWVETGEAERASSRTEGTPIAEGEGTYEENPGDYVFRRAIVHPLPPRPRIRLEFSHDVPLAEVLKAVYFQDSKTKERLPVEVNLEERQALGPQGWVLVEPVQPLPVGRSFLLVVEPLKEAIGQQALPNLRVLIAGTTYPLKVKNAAPLNQPVRGAFVRVTLNQPVDPDPANLKLITVEPEIGNLRFEIDQKRVEVMGAFNPSTEYRVRLKTGFRSRGGYALTEDSTWKAHFRAKRPAIILPEEVIFQRASLPSLRCSFVQVNTKELQWRLARLPREKFVVANERLREFRNTATDAKGETAKDPQTGEYVYQGTDLLIPALALQVVGAGRIDPSMNDAETPRVIEWRATDRQPGVYLLEIWGRDLRGRAVGNRVIVSRGDWMVTVVESKAAEDIIRVANMSDGQPARGVAVELLETSGPIAAFRTDSNGEILFGPALKDRKGRVIHPTLATAIVVGEPGRECLQFPDLTKFRARNIIPVAEGGRWIAPGEPRFACVIITDRNVYRPGEIVKFKGFVRVIGGPSLSIPANKPVRWTISGSAPDSGEDSSQSLYEGNGFVSPTGDWEGEWTVPPSAFGEYFISALDGAVKVTVAEFRPPAFSVLVESKDTQGETVTAKITSQHFHGAPNAGAKVHWKTEWVVDDWRRASPLAAEVALNRREAKHIAKVLSDKYSPDSSTQGFSDDVMRRLKEEGWATARLDREVSVTAAREGDVTLDANGVATVECKSPFPADGKHGRAKVYWLVDVTSGSAVTHRGGTVARVQFVPQILGVSLESRGYHKALVEVASFDAHDEPGAGILSKAELFRVEIKTVKEEISRGLNRYRNYPVFEKIWQADVTTPSSQIVNVERTGNYVLRVTAPSQPHTPQVSDTEMIAGWGNADVAIEDESSIACKPDRERYTVGDTANITVQTPFGGVATVTVETDRILYRQTVQLSGNAQRISVPIQSTFAPNAYVCVHIIKPADADGLPSERFGVCEIKVDRSDQHLEVKPVLASDVFEPGAMISGVVKVSNQGRPVPGADLMLFAVDEAVLQLGRWKLPDFDETFFPRRAWEVETHCALGLLWTPEKPESLSHSQKGFIIGDGGPLLTEATVRKDFAPLAFWNARIATNAAGEAPFRFKAPDGLTSYRVVAVAQRGADQFGNGEKLLRLSKKLQIEPILPDFLRQSDELYLRLLVRQDHKDEDTINVTLAPDPGLEPLEPLQKSVTVKRGEPSLASFHVKVGHAPQAKIDLTARSTGTGTFSDHVRNTLTIHPSVLQRRQTLVGQIKPTQPLDLITTIPPAWLGTSGVCDVMLSGSTYLPKIAGLPAMLEVQGSVEKISTQILAATLLAETLDYVPFASDKSWRARTEAALKRLAPAVLDGGGLSVWPSGGKLNGFATVEAAWAILLAKKKELNVDEKLVRNAERWLDNIIRREFGFNEVPPDIRCFALMVRGHTRDDNAKKGANFESEAEELFNNRRELTDEGRAWLALGSWYLEIKPNTVNTLLREIDHPLQAADFDPEKFGSSTRAEALCLLAQSEIQGTNWPAAVRERVRRQFDRITQSSVDLSTQENLWLMMLFNSLTRGEIPARVQRAARTLSSKPPVFSRNETSAGWLGVPLHELREVFPRPLQLGVDGSYLVRAVYEVPESEVPTHAPSLNIERSIRNLTDGTRTGKQSAPFKLGDQILVTYLMNADTPHSYVEIEDQLPACLETINPKLPLIAKYFQLPIEAGVNTLPLSHVELRFARTLLYFDKVLPGRNAYSVLSRVTNAGVFHWPGTQVRPLYDSRFSDTSNQMLAYAVE